MNALPTPVPPRLGLIMALADQEDYDTLLEIIPGKDKYGRYVLSSSALARALRKAGHQISESTIDTYRRNVVSKSLTADE